MLFDALSRRTKVRDPTAYTMVTGTPGAPAAVLSGTETMAMKLSAVDRCVSILSGSMSKLPVYCVDTVSRKRVPHPVLELLNVRPNEAMTPSVHKQVLESSRLLKGNAYDWILRDPRSRAPVELIPIPEHLVRPWLDVNGHVWYDVQHPLTGTPMTLSGEDVRHFKGYSANGLKGIGVLERAGETIAGALAAQTYNRSFFEGDAQPSGILTVDADLGGDSRHRKNADGTPMSKKDVLREEWGKRHAGPSGAHRIAILDLGLKYQAIATTPKDAMLIESAQMSVRDIARHFGVPLPMLFEGKEAYNSNEQQALSYVSNTLHPTVTQYDEENTYKLLPDRDIQNGLQLSINMMAELKGDTATRGAWYRNLREIGAFSVNDIRALEDMEDVPGGDERYASWNYGPLREWADLSIKRNGGNENA